MRWRVDSTRESVDATRARPRAALISGHTQFAFVGVIPAITAVAKEVPIKIVTSSDDAAAAADKDWQTLVVPNTSLDDARAHPGEVRSPTH